MDEAIVRIGDSEYTDSEYSENDSNNAISEALSKNGVLEVVEILMRFDEVLVER
jgi:hypothetical protein